MNSAFSQQRIVAIAIGALIGLIVGTVIVNFAAGIGFAIFGGAIGYAWTLYTADRKAGRDER